ncbi:MAG TPA: VWA domain-containing protein, partial [Kofleriaceae bacterium]|nr:VWA domain-containing protein [Kofleriaceae bacterium]
GRTAALLEQERADIFTQQIGNIPPGEAVVARITIDQRLVWLPEGEWELRFPTVIGPRYIGSVDTAADIRATHIKVTDKPLSASINIAIAIKDVISGGGKASSPTHSLSTSSGVTELSAGARLDRDIVLRWPVAAPAPGISVATAAASQGAFGLLTIVPPSRTAKPTPVPRDLIVLLDTSGSMSGGPLEKAQQVVSMMLDSLNEGDRFELIEFNMQPTRYNDEPLVATAKAKAAAIKWVRSRVADGGTEMRAGVIEAMQSLRVGAQRQIVIVTDGYVGGERQILEAINRRLPKSCRIHVLGVGSAVNRSLATALARAGRGVEVLVGIDDDAERGAKRLLDRTSTPLLTNVEITGSAVLRHAPDRIPDVFERAPLVAALAVRPEGGQIVVRGQLGTEDWEQTITVPPTKPGDGNGAILALYGRERVADVEANALFGSVDGDVEELGITFQIATRMTSWVAIDETRKVSGPTRDELVPQELPYGTSAGAFGLRGAAAPMPMQMQRTQAGMAGAAMTRAGVVKSAKLDLSEAMDGDFGEDAPSEIFAEEAKKEVALDQFETEESTGQLGVPAARDSANQPMSSSPPRYAPAPPRPAAGQARPSQPAAPPLGRTRAASYDADDEADERFGTGSGGPTGGEDRSVSPPPAMQPAAPRPTESARGPMSRPAPEPERSADKGRAAPDDKPAMPGAHRVPSDFKIGAAAPIEDTSKLPQPKQAELAKVKPRDVAKQAQEAQAPATAAAKRSAWLVALIALIGLVALVLLLWWLLA